jgi:arsenate reductase-like glutaredoxin family protein
MITLYGAKDCHKTQFYINLLKSKSLVFDFKDVILNNEYANELKNLYETKRLNFPTFLIGDKKLRNPSEIELTKWLTKFDLV